MSRAAYTVMEHIREVVNGDASDFSSDRVFVQAHRRAQGRIVTVQLDGDAGPLIATIVQPFHRPQFDNLQLCFGGQYTANAERYVNYVLEAFGPHRDVDYVERNVGEFRVRRMNGDDYWLADAYAWFPAHQPSRAAQDYRALHALVHSKLPQGKMREIL
jgi:hypothetical protein